MRDSTESRRSKPAPIRTSQSSRPSTSQQNERQTPTQPQSPRLNTTSSEDDSAGPRQNNASQNFVLIDPIAFRYLAEDSSTQIVTRHQELQGYECYIVEQWTTSRKHPTFVITTYTGDLTRSVIVGVLSVPTDESTWSPRLRTYFKALNQYHARRRETPLGILMVTTLSGFPSSLTVIPVPGGDLTKHRHDFFVNEDLKRLGCAGRIGLALIQPSAATVSKFHQLYRISDKINFYSSVIELVKLCQSALMLFDKLEVDYADGLLCDVTERAINDWWADIGSDQYGIEPHDGILGPTTVAGLLGLLLGARNRLSAANAPVAKDAFDVEAMKRGIAAFQKQQKIPKTRRLDRRTLDLLHRATQKNAEKERWGVPKAVKTTVAELSGRDLLTEHAGRRDKAGIADIETVDIDRFSQLIYGDRCKWLWLGKPLKKSRGGDEEDGAPQEAYVPASVGKDLVLRADEHGGFMWTPLRKGGTDDFAPQSKHHGESRFEESGVPHQKEDGDEGEDSTTKMSVFRRATNLRDEAKSSLGKVRGAVGLRGHRPKPSVDDHAVPIHEPTDASQKRPAFRRAHTSPMSSPSGPDSPSRVQLDDLEASQQSDRLNKVLHSGDGDMDESQMPDNLDSKSRSHADLTEASETNTRADTVDDSGSQKQPDQDQDPDRPSASTTAEPSIAGSVYNGHDLNDTLPSGPATDAGLSNLLKKRLSFSQFIDVQLQSQSDHAYSRHLSFSLAEESILKWTPPDEDNREHDLRDDVNAQYILETEFAEDAKRLRHIVEHLRSHTVTWTQAQLDTLAEYSQQTDRDLHTVEQMHEPQVHHVQSLQAHSEGILIDDKEQLVEGIREIEAMGAKLDYEIDGLRTKVEDVEAGVSDFEKGVARVEERVVELEKEGERRLAWGCIVS